MAKKSHNHKAQREEQRQKNKERGAHFNQIEQEKAKQQEAEAAKNNRAPASKQKKIEVHVSNKKTRAKAAGVKSMFALEDQSVLVTSFGKGNAPLSEKKIVDRAVSDLRDPAAFSLQTGEANTYEVHGRGGITAKPNAPALRRDLIHCKDELEDRYFGRLFYDTIHIQAIYSILDLEKTLAVHINNIVFTINNLFRNDQYEEDDFLGIGYLSTRNDFATYRNPEQTIKDAELIKNIKESNEFFDKLLKNSRLFYFGEAFTNEKGVKPEEDVYWALALLSSLRQFCAHDNTKMRGWLYCLDEMVPEGGKEYLARNYNDTVEKLAKGFVKKDHSSNFTLLFTAFNVQTDEEKVNLAFEYFDFTMRKSYKNMGFSIKVLREYLLQKPELATFADDKYSTIRNKIYQIFDFALFKMYKDDPAATLSFVEKLRATMDKEDKERVYREEADRIASRINNTLQRVKPLFDKVLSKEINKLNLDSKMVQLIDEKISQDGIHAKSTHIFTQLIYLVTQVIDGKEINDLLTTLIHQFENIDSFLQTMRENNIPCEFKEEFRFFEESGTIAEELRLVNSFARMTKINAAAKQAMLLDAAHVLGTDWDDDRILDEFHLDKKEGHGFRNFIINNVIESRKFHYLIRFANVKNLRQLADNESVVQIVLKTLPDDQIARYVETCGIMAGNPIRMLTKAITTLKFDDFTDVNQAADATVNRDKAKKQALVNLYLTVLYLLTKNLININARYFLAFHCLERDSRTKGKSSFRKDYCLLAKDLVEERWDEAQKRFADSKKQYSDKKRYYEAKRVHDYIMLDMEHTDQVARDRFRDNVAHLNIVRHASDLLGTDGKFESYYQLYHYLMQRDLANEYERELEGAKPNPTTLGYFDELDKYHGLSKDFIKALCVPFAYNLPRFKNLSIEALFDKNNPPETNLKPEAKE